MDLEALAKRLTVLEADLAHHKKERELLLAKVAALEEAQAETHIITEHRWRVVAYALLPPPTSPQLSLLVMDFESLVALVKAQSKKHDDLEAQIATLTKANGHLVREVRETKILSEHRYVNIAKITIMLEDENWEDVEIVGTQTLHARKPKVQHQDSKVNLTSDQQNAVRHLPAALVTMETSRNIICHRVSENELDLLLTQRPACVEQRAIAVIEAFVRKTRS